MNRNDINTAISNETGFNKKDIDMIVNCFIKTVTKAVAHGHEVNLPNLGKFERVFKQQRAGRNPQTSEEIIIKAKHVPKFSVAKGFKDLVKEHATINQ